MDSTGQSSEARFVAYVESLTAALGHADRAQPLMDYCTGLLMPGERKSVEPMAAVVAPKHVAAKHQSLLHFVGQAAWSDNAMLNRIRELVLPSIEANGEIEAWLVDDTSFVKKGVHSVGVARQYCGRQSLTAQNWQDRKLSGRGDLVTRQSRGQPACGLSFIFA